MNFVTWAIRNPTPVIVMFIALMIGGVISFERLGVQDLPDIEFPTVTVSVGYPGVPPSQMESEVTRKIEDAVATVTGVQHIQSRVNVGSSTTTVEFLFDRDISQAMDDVRDAVTRIRSDLPADANEPIVSRATTAGQPILTYSVAAEGMSDTDLSWFIDLTVMRELTAVAGVGQVNRVGGVSREIRVDLDPDRLTALGITAGDLSRQLARIQAEYPGGEARVGGLEQNVRTVGTITSAQELAALPILLPDGRNLRLDTVAEIRDQASERRQLALLDGQPVVGFEIMRAWGASALGVADDVRIAVEKLQAANPNVKFTEVSSTVGYIRQSFDVSMEMLLEGAILAIAVVWFFLRDWRATIVSAVALPLAIIPTFWAMQLLGYTLNTLTLLALSLVVGMLVDDAIVEVENIFRHLRMGKTPLQAATDAAIEIGLAVVATTLTLCAVFVPVAFMGGVPGEFFRPFAFTATVAVLFSLLVARMLTPMMAANLMRPHDQGPETSPMKEWYLRSVTWCLKHRRITLGVATALLFGSFSLLPLLPQGFSPAGDVGFTEVAVELPPGSTLEETHAVAEDVRGRLQGIPEVQRVYTTIGSSSTGRGPGDSGTSGSVNRASLQVVLSPIDDRDRSQQEIQRDIMARITDVPGVRISFGNQFGSAMQITLVGEDPDALNAAAAAVEQDMRGIPGLGIVSSSASLVRPEIVVRPLPERAAELGVTTESLGMVTRIATSGDISAGLSKLNLPSRQIPIRVRMNDKARTDVDQIGLLTVSGRQGPVALRNVADISFGAGPAQISRYDRNRNVTITADLNGQALGDMLAAARATPSMQRLPETVREVVSGQAEFFRQLMSGFLFAMAIGILCIYALLVVLFKDAFQPITILSALPPSAGGAILCLFVFQFEISISSMIGMLMLMGIVTKNSILLVEYAEMAQREHGMGRFEALVDACAKRVRPIVMTTIAMGAGMLPIALGLSGDASFRAPMGVTVIGGLVASTALSLFVVPVIFTLVDDFQKWLKRKVGLSPVPAVVAQPTA
jgi:multidrug efflux pump subunit AcrB